MSTPQPLSALAPPTAAATGTDTRRPAAPRAPAPLSSASHSLVLFATYAGLIAILLPIQVAAIDAAEQDLQPRHRDDDLVRLHAVRPADRRRVQRPHALAPRPPRAVDDHRRGRRRASSWSASASLSSILWITVFWVIIQVALNALQGPLTRDHRPTASRAAKRGMRQRDDRPRHACSACTVGIIVAGSSRANVGLGYTVFGAAVLVVTAAVRRWSTGTARARNAVRPPFSWRAFFAGFWINPTQEPRLRLGVRGALPVHPRLLRRHDVPAVHPHRLHRPAARPRRSGAVGAPQRSRRSSPRSSRSRSPAGGATSSAVARSSSTPHPCSWWSASPMPLLMPTMTGMLIMSVINGFGFGLYMAMRHRPHDRGAARRRRRGGQGPRHPQRRHQHPAGAEPGDRRRHHRLARRLPGAVRLRA